MTWNSRENERARRTVKSRIAEKAFNVINRAYKLEIYPEHSANLQEADRRLRHNPVVIYSNHVRSGDLKLMTPILLSMQNAQRIAGPAGMKHWDLHRDAINGTLLRSLRLVGIRSIPVVQPDDPYPYEDKLKTHLLLNFTRRTASLLNQPGTLYGIAPEGTRNPAGIIQRVSPGIGMFESFMKAPDMQITYQPIGFVYREQDPEEPRIVIAPPFTLSELLPESNLVLLHGLKRQQRAQITADLLMTVLAEQLPDHMRGVYGDPEEMLKPIGMTQPLLDAAIFELPSSQGVFAS